MKKKTKNKLMSYTIILIFMSSSIISSGTSFSTIKDAWKVQGNGDSSNGYTYGWFGWHAVYANDWERFTGYWDHQKVYNYEGSNHEFTLYWKVGDGKDTKLKHARISMYNYVDKTWVVLGDKESANGCQYFGVCDPQIIELNYDFTLMSNAGYIKNLGSGNYELKINYQGWYGYSSSSSITDTVQFDFLNV